MATRAKTEIRFREGVDTVTEVPKEARTGGLRNRLAIIQETYRPDKVDMYFDEALFRQLLDYAQGFSIGGIVEVIDASVLPETKTLLTKFLGRNRCTESARSIEQFLGRWSLTPPEDREPPLRIVVRNNGKVILCISTEFWTRVGGPPEYHDSYTYSVFSRENLSGEIRSLLAASPDAKNWDIQSAA